MRKSLALALIKLAHRVYPPKVTEVNVHVTDVTAAKHALTEWEAKMRAARQATRWN